ncbi:MAG TPA: isopentenyl transferase family protein, partial [Candidatus Saccharimonadales bacterium]|nr:isopentenyl transferase family protein [Candidatus Saccharimonadales bacterium]
MATGQTPLIVIVGETASGKSALAMRLAKHFDGEIIAADSWTVYKDFDIGTAKPTPEEQVEIPHHLLDVADPKAGFSAPQFKRLAEQAIHDVSARGKLPFLVGGTGLYVDSVIYNYQFLPGSSPAQREQLNALSLHDLHQQAEAMGLDTTGIDMRNKRRVIRLIETNGARPTKEPLRP